MSNLVIVLKPNLLLEKDFVPIALANNIAGKLYLTYIKH